MALVTHGLMYGLQCDIYFEWAESKSNWSDGISREGYRDRRRRRNGFTCRTLGHNTNNPARHRCSGLAMLNRVTQQLMGLPLFQDELCFW